MGFFNYVPPANAQGHARNGRQLQNERSAAQWAEMLRRHQKFTHGSGIRDDTCRACAELRSKMRAARLESCPTPSERSHHGW